MEWFDNILRKIGIVPESDLKKEIVDLKEELENYYLFTDVLEERLKDISEKSKEFKKEAEELNELCNLYLQDKETNVVINIDYKQEQDFNFYLDLPKDVKEIKVYFDEQEKQFKIKETELNNFVNILGTAVKIRIEYDSESYIEKSSKNYFTAEVIPLIDGNLEREKIVMSKKLGKAVFYRLNLEDLYTRRVIETLLIEEARSNAQRWIDEFKEVFNYTEIVIIFGSIIKNPKHANDTDVIFVYKIKNHRGVSNFISAKNKILFKKIHDIPQTIDDLKENLKKNPAIIDALRSGYILHGYDKIVEVIKNVTSF